MDTINTQHPLAETTYSTESNAGKPLPDQAPPYTDNDEELEIDIEDDELENQNKDWK